MLSRHLQETTKAGCTEAIEQAGKLVKDKKRKKNNNEVAFLSTELQFSSCRKQELSAENRLLHKVLCSTQDTDPKKFATGMELVGHAEGGPPKYSIPLLAYHSVCFNLSPPL